MLLRRSAALALLLVGLPSSLANAASYTVSSTSGPGFANGSGLFSTGMELTKGTPLTITANGTFFNGVVDATPAGFPSPPDPIYGATVLPSVASNSLVGGTGTAPNGGFKAPLYSAGPAVNGPGYVGTDYKGKTTDDGILNFAINDTPLNDNSGSLSVTVKLATCADILKGAVGVTAGGNEATFKPKFDLTLAEAAKVCNVVSFNWIQWVTYDDDANRPTIGGVSVEAPYLDPPLGGYDEDPDDNLVGYFNSTNMVDFVTSDSLRFVDYPVVSEGSKVQFKTVLAGVDAMGNVKAIGTWWKWEATSTGTRIRRQNTDPSFVTNQQSTLLGVFSIDDFTTEDIQFLTSRGIGIDDSRADFDEDGDVDGRDFLTWQRGAGTDLVALHQDGNANDDDLVDAADLAIWRNQFGVLPAAAAIPEPPTFIAMALAILSMSAYIRSVRTSGFLA